MLGGARAALLDYICSEVSVWWHLPLHSLVVVSVCSVNRISEEQGKF